MDENNTPKPKPGLRKSADKPVKIYDAVVEDTQATATELVAEVVEVVEETPAPAPAKEAAVKAPTSAYAVVGSEDADPVYLSKCVRNDLQRKSLTVHHLQRRLREWGYADCFADRDGYYGTNTSKSVADFQSANQLEATGVMTAATLEAIFAGDTNVKVIIDA